MADLSKIRLNGTTYNFKDTWARTNLQTSSQVQNAITTALGNITGFEISIVQTLPATGNQGTFYFVPNSQGSGNNIYDEYVYVNNSWEKIGTTEIDLSDYLQKTDIAAWAKAANKPNYTANEVGALPSTTSIPSKTSDLTNDSGYITSSDIPQEIFWATYGTTTSAQIEAAYQAGKVVCVKYNSSIYSLSYRANATNHTFGSDVAETHYSLNCINNVWSTLTTTHYPPLDANEKIIDYYLPDYHDIFWAEYGTTTNTEIITALVAGKVPVVVVSGRLLIFKCELGVNMHRFSCVDNGTEYSATCASDTWGTSTQSFIPVGSNGKIAVSYLPIYDGTVE